MASLPLRRLVSNEAVRGRHRADAALPRALARSQLGACYSQPRAAIPREHRSKTRPQHLPASPQHVQHPAILHLLGRKLAEKQTPLASPINSLRLSLQREQPKSLEPARVRPQAPTGALCAFSGLWGGCYVRGCNKFNIVPGTEARSLAQVPQAARLSGRSPRAGAHHLFHVPCAQVSHPVPFHQRRNKVGSRDRSLQQHPTSRRSSRMLPVSPGIRHSGNPL